MRYFALRSLGSFQHASAAPAVRDCLERDPAGQVRLAAIDVLGRLQPADILSVLEPLVASDDADTARAAIRALRHVQDPAAEAALDALSRADEVWRRLETVVALGDRGGSQAVSTLEWVAAADEERDVAEAAVSGLATLASRDDEQGAAAARALVALTAEPSRRESAVAALARLPVRRVSDVASGLAHASPSVRRATVDALSRMRHTDATRWIETALDDAIAGGALGRGGGTAPARQPERHAQACHAGAHRSRSRSPPRRDDGERLAGIGVAVEFRAESLGLSGGVTAVLRDAIHERLGLTYEPSQFDQLADRLAPLVIARGLGSFMDYYYVLKYSDDATEWGRVMDALAVQETYFWREIDQVRAMVDEVVPELVANSGGRPLRIWSVPCASGEEPLTIAMLLAEQGWFGRAPIEIVGSDASPAVIAKARAGRVRPALVSQPAARAPGEVLLAVGREILDRLARLAAPRDVRRGQPG